MDNPRGGNARVLLVDDEPDQLDMYRLGLEDAGFVVLTVERGRAAIDHVRSEAPDVIVLDLRLPDISGWQVCAMLKADPLTSRIPIIILTAAASPTLAQDAANAGCAAALLKPCYPIDLGRTILKVLAAVPRPFGV